MIDTISFNFWLRARSNKAIVKGINELTIRIS